MSAEIASDVVAALAEGVAPASDDVLRDMEDRAAATDFPIVGPSVGG